MKITPCATVSKISDVKTKGGYFRKPKFKIVMENDKSDYVMSSGVTLGSCNANVELIKKSKENHG